MRAWIEITLSDFSLNEEWVALFMRAWIEIWQKHAIRCFGLVALFMRAWIEILTSSAVVASRFCRSLHESVD